MCRRGDAGSVYVEFLVVFGPLALLWLGIAQFGLLLAADLLVRHAAYRAARAAIVVLADEREEYDGVAPNEIGIGGEGLQAYEQAPASGRLETIRRAARIPLSPLSPSLGGGRGAELVAGYLWTASAVAVTFPDSNGGYKARFAPKEAITTRVTYLYRCPIPVVDLLMCRSYWGGLDELPAGIAQRLRESGGGLGGLLFARGIDGAARAELDTVGGGLLGAAALGVSLAGKSGARGGMRFVALRADATLVNQGRAR